MSDVWMKLSKHAEATHSIDTDVIDIFNVVVGACGKLGNVDTAVESNLPHCKQCLAYL